MASISTDKNGLRRIQFVDGNGKRKAIRLGRTPLRQVREIKLRVEAMAFAKRNNHSIDTETAGWLKNLEDNVYAKFVAAGLAPERHRQQARQLREYCESYIDSRPDIAANSKRNMTQVTRYLTAFLGPDRDVSTVTAADAERFAARVKADYAEATACRAIKRARQFFKVAVRDGLIASNPFFGIKVGSMSNPARMYFVTRDETARLLSACPDAEWRLIIALARYGGLRTPTEHLVLTWDDVHWERNRFLVRSTKTGARWVPIFPELRPYLEEARNRAEPDAVHVVTRTRNVESNWRTTFNKIVARAGLKIWEKPFQNMRASRESELAKSHPIHIVCAWIGNSVPVAAKHYLQTTEEDFDLAAGGAAHNQTQQENATDCNGKQELLKSSVEKCVLTEITENQDILTSVKMPPAGAESNHVLADDSHVNTAPGVATGAVTIDSLAKFAAALSTEERAALARMLTTEMPPTPTER